MEIQHSYMAEWLIRSLLGILFFAQGYDKLIKVGIPKVYETFQYEMAQKNIPGGLIYMAAIFTSVVEFFGGILLLLGLGTDWTLYVLGLDLILVALAFVILDPMWDMQILFPRLVLLLTLLLLPSSYEFFSLDYLFGWKH